MNDTAHIFHPQDDSLSERVRAYQSCSEALKNAKTSLDLVDDNTWSDRLGSREEVELAVVIAERSAKMAISQLSQSDAEQAVGKGLLNGDELKELVQFRRLQDIQNRRSDQRSQNTSKHQQKR